MIYMFLSNNPSSGDINSSNLPCLDSFGIKIFMVKQNIFHHKLKLTLTYFNIIKKVR